MSRQSSKKNEGQGASAVLNTANTVNPIDLTELLFVLLRKWYLLLLGMILGGAALGGYTYMQPLQYQSESMIFVLSETTSITSLADLQLGSELSDDFLVISTSKPVLDSSIEAVQEELGITLTREQVSDMLTVSADSDRILTITIVSEDPQLACSLANAVTDAIMEQIASIMKSDPPTIIESAEVSDTPLDNGLVSNAMKGAVLGLLLMAILIVVPHLLNNKVRSPEDFDKYLGGGLLGVVPFDKSQVYRSPDAKKRKRRKS